MNKVTKEQIKELIDKSEKVIYHRIFGKQCVVIVKLPNGFTIVGESACVDPTNYVDIVGYDLAMERIESKLWELEGYKLQDSLDK